MQQEPKYISSAVHAGWDEISRLRQLLEADMFTSRDYLILPLHSMVPPADQKAVFRAAPPGVRKVTALPCTRLSTSF